MSDTQATGPIYHESATDTFYQIVAPLVYKLVHQYINHQPQYEFQFNCTDLVARYLPVMGWHYGAAVTLATAIRDSVQEGRAVWVPQKLFNGNEVEVTFCLYAGQHIRIDESGNHNLWTLKGTTVSGVSYEAPRLFIRVRGPKESARLCAEELWSSHAPK